MLGFGSLEETLTVIEASGSPSAPVAVDAAMPDRLRQQTALDGITPPVKTRDRAPVYPDSIRGTGIEGRVVLEGRVNTEGMVEVAPSSAPVDPALTTVYRDLLRSAVEAVGGWRYEPGLLHGSPVATPITINVEFRP